MKMIRLSIGSLFLALFVCMALPAQAQSLNQKKEVKKVMKTLSEPAQQAVVKYAAARLTGKEEGIAITDGKTLKKYFNLLAPEAQSQVLDFAKNSAESMAKLASNKPAPAAKPVVTRANPTPAPRPAPALKPAPGTMVKPKPATPARPAQPAYMLEAESMVKTTVQWLEEEHDFGEIKQGEVATHTYKFKNVGEHPLKITRAKASCGCTVPEWSKEPIAPGGEGHIKISFNTRGKSGFQMKSVTVTHNGEPLNKVLRFKGKVVMPTAAPAPAPVKQGGK